MWSTALGRRARHAVTVASLALAVLAARTGPTGAGTEIAPSGPQVPIESALESALRAYRSGELEAAQSWAALATSLLEEAAAAGPKARWQRSNAAQLLEVLGLYGQVAYGRDPARDGEFDWLVPWLEAIHSVNLDPSQPSAFRDWRLDYDPFTRLVRRFGDLQLDYDPFTRQLRRVGDMAIDYDPFTRQPRRIGAIAIDYDPFDHSVRSIAGVSLP